jgi:hypothetical protein
MELRRRRTAEEEESGRRQGVKLWRRGSHGEGEEDTVVWRFISELSLCLAHSLCGLC